ncbi:hypothetical protein HDU99_008529 [Rhizoclosmatium hyalinum]|nr:hypothetical protein HDU99_008529 [Rhizoclosmatium hyalinum]
MQLSSAVSLIALASTVSAHFLVGAPPSRPFDDDGELIAPCGGQALGARSQFPITGGVVSGGLYHPTGTANFSLVVSNVDPTADQFGQVPFGPGFNVKFTEGLWSTDKIDLSQIPGCVDGANVTMQVVMTTVDGTLFVCMDVTLDKTLTADPISSPVPTKAGGGSAANVTATATTAKAVVPTSAVTTSAKGSNGFVSSVGATLFTTLLAFLF